MCVRVFGAQRALQSVAIVIFRTLTSQPAPQEGFFPEPSSSPSSPSPWLPGNLERCRCPWARTAADRHAGRPAAFNSQIWQREKEAKRQDFHTGNYFATSKTAPKKKLSDLQQAVADQRHQEVVAVALAHHGGVFRSVHAGEVEHGHVGLAVVVDGKVQRGQLVAGGEVGSLAGVRQQRRLVHVGPGQQQLRVGVVLPHKRPVSRWKSELRAA